MDKKFLVKDAHESISCWQNTIAHLYMQLDGRDALSNEEKSAFQQMQSDLYRIVDNLKKVEGEL